MDKIFINAAMNLLDNWPAQRCFAHTLQFSIRAVLKMKAIAKSTVLQGDQLHTLNAVMLQFKLCVRNRKYYNITTSLQFWKLS